MAETHDEDKSAVVAARNYINLALSVPEDVVEIIRRRALIMRRFGFAPVKAMEVALDPTVNTHFAFAQLKLKSAIEDLSKEFV